MTTVNGKEMEHGLCPLMSGFPVPGRSMLAGPGAVEIGTMMVPCCGDDCQLWDQHRGRCGAVAGSEGIEAQVEKVVDRLSKIAEDLDNNLTDIRLAVRSVADVLSSIGVVLAPPKSGGVAFQLGRLADCFEGAAASRSRKEVDRRVDAAIKKEKDSSGS